MGGFDTHGGQVQAGNTVSGNHAHLLKNVSDAIAAFPGRSNRNWALANG